MHRRASSAAVRRVVILVLGLTLAFPVFYLISGSFMSFQEISRYPPGLVPSSFEVENYTAAIDYLKVRTIVNTFVFVLGVLFLQLSVSLLAGFALARIRFRGSRIMLVLFVIPLFIPMNLIFDPGVHRDVPAWPHRHVSRTRSCRSRRKYPSASSCFASSSLGCLTV